MKLLSKPFNLKWQNILLWVVVGLLFYGTILHKLGSIPLQPWDEALFALRALFMYEQGSYMSDFSLMLGDEMAHRNTKLPFTTFLQVASMKLFGVNVFALRLPNILLFAGACWYVIRFSKKHLNEIWVGILFILMMTSSTAWVRPHMIWTGDQDTAFASYILVGLLSFYSYLENKKTTSIALFSFCFIAAALTKNLMAFIPGVAILLYIMSRGKLLDVLKDKKVWSAVLLLFTVYLGTIFYLNESFPGFIDRMWNYELGGRFTNEIENVGPWYKYIIQLAWGWNLPFLLFALYAIYQIVETGDSKYKNLVSLLTIHCVFYLIVISISQTKCDWYDAAIAPAYLLLSAIGFLNMWEKVKSSKNKSLSVIALVIMTLAILVPYSQLAYDRSTDNYLLPNAKYGPFMERLAEKHPEYTNYIVAVDKWAFTQIWYMKKLNQKGFNITHDAELDYFPGDKIVVCHYKPKNKIAKKYTYNVLYHENDSCLLLTIKSRNK